jgi:hypothetical protein
VDRVRPVGVERKNEIRIVQALALARNAPTALVAIHAQANSRGTTVGEILTSGKLQISLLRAAVRDLESFISRYGAGTPEAMGPIKEARAIFADKLARMTRSESTSH